MTIEKFINGGASVCSSNAWLALIDLCVGDAFSAFASETLSPPLEQFLLIQNSINGGASVYLGNALLTLKSVSAYAD